MFNIRHTHFILLKVNTEIQVRPSLWKFLKFVVEVLDNTNKQSKSLLAGATRYSVVLESILTGMLPRTPMFYAFSVLA